MFPKQKRSWRDLPEDLPVDVLPCSNGEFMPRDATREEMAIMELAEKTTETWRRKMGMSRRQFVRTSMAFSIGFWAINRIRPGRWGYYAMAADTPGGKTNAACDLTWSPDRVGTLETVQNLPGEFIFDVQSHHVESDGYWRVTNPAFEAFFGAVWSQAGPLGNRENGSTNGFGYGHEIDPIENLSQYHYFKELFLDSATTMTVLSAVPAAPDITQPLPIRSAADTVGRVNSLSGALRTVMHAFVMPNRGSAGSVASAFGKEPVYMQAEFEEMDRRADDYKDIIRGWKTYPAWGDVPYASGWFFDDEIVGQKFIEKVIAVSQVNRGTVAKPFYLPANIATHKGFALPGFDQRAASPRDIGRAASRNWNLKTNEGATFIVYHSGYDGDNPMTAYGGPPPNSNFDPAGDAARGDATVNSSDRTVSSLVKSLREANWDALRFAGAPWYGNVPNVYAEIGSTWRSVMNNPDDAAHLLGKLIRYVGPRRIAWGTDSLWFGSPQREIIALRKLKFTQAANDFYGLADGIDSDADDPTKSTLVGANYTGPNSNRPDVNWPTDGRPHPERSIRNAIFGYNAAVAYRVPASAEAWYQPEAAWGTLGSRGITPFPSSTGPAGLAVPENVDPRFPIDCKAVQSIRDDYILNKMTPSEEVPLRSNALVGPRTRRELIKMRKEQPWGP